VALENELKRQQTFRLAITIELNEAKRNLVSQQAKILSDSLDKAAIDYQKFSEEFNNTFSNVLQLLKDKIELIHPTKNTLTETLNSEFLNENKELRDNFILRCILNHCQENQGINKAFFSRNSKQFNKSEIQGIFQQVNLNYFADFQSLINWIQ
jgi:hypothetical protein